MSHLKVDKFLPTSNNKYNLLALAKFKVFNQEPSQLHFI